MARLLIVKAHPFDSKTSYVLRALEDFLCLYQEEYPGMTLKKSMFLMIFPCWIRTS